MSEFTDNAVTKTKNKCVYEKTLNSMILKANKNFGISNAFLNNTTYYILRYSISK